jgi:hypothetical protein
MPQFIKEEEFDRKLGELSDAYEKIKDHLVLDQYTSDIVWDSLRLLRDTAATGLRAQYEITTD